MERALQEHRPVGRDERAAARPTKLRRVCGWQRRAALAVVLVIGTAACAQMRPPVIGKSGYPIGMPCIAVNCRNGTPGGIFHRVRMPMANLNFSDFSEADLREADLSASDMYRAKFRDADMRDAQLRSANLRGADFRGANLTRAVLLKANLRDADFRGADLTKTVLLKANLRDADLAGALLRGADLRGARLDGANLADANLDGALLPAGFGEHEGSGSVPGPGAR